MIIILIIIITINFTITIMIYPKIYISLQIIPISFKSIIIVVISSMKNLIKITNFIAANLYSKFSITKEFVGLFVGLTLTYLRILQLRI